ncbi:hypothetical protein, partial [Vulcaniibacterium gelatinicum]|uniref:hypothetical protein n=1 Tax=Vulcaniibacterium gelatinicum TaxID=2598725 RepID=UPI001C70850C
PAQLPGLVPGAGAERSNGRRSRVIAQVGHGMTIPSTINANSAIFFPLVRFLPKEGVQNARGDGH